MLLLLMRNMLWAAWWPYATMLLALEKAAQQKDREAQRPQAQAQPQRPSQSPPPQPGGPEESAMGNDAFMQPELPPPCAR